MKQLTNCYEQIYSPENLWRAWILYRRGKRHRQDVRQFERSLESNLLDLQKDLKSFAYQHAGYRSFVIHDPKRRTIHAPIIRDQLVHQALWNILFPFFNRRFSHSVFSCRPRRGTHAGVKRIRSIAKTIGNRNPVFILYIDIIKFFDSVHQERLKNILCHWIDCPKTLVLLEKIIDGYDSGFRASTDSTECKRGIPLGNLTSQLFCNVSLMPFDRFVMEQGLGHAYVRYADDIFVLGDNAVKLASFGIESQAFFQQHGFSCRQKVVRYHGFEALGKRFFIQGLAMRQTTQTRAFQKAKRTIHLYQTDQISVRAFDASLQSLFGLTTPVRDRRWTNAIQQAILKETYVP